MLKPVRNVLVIKLREIGDTVLSTPVLRILNDTCNSPEITYVLKKEHEQLKYVLPHVKHVVTYDKKETLGFWRTVFELRHRKYDLAVCLHASFRSALLALLSGAKIRLVHNHSGKNWFSSIPLRIKEGPKPNTIRDIETLSPLQIKINPELMRTKLTIREEMFGYVDFDGEKTVGFGIGAKRMQKTWPKERFAYLGAHIAAAGYKIAVMCTMKEKKEAEYIAGKIGQAAAIFMESLPVTAYMISKMSLFIGNDSALVHIAAAVGTKSITIFGPEDPAEWHPYQESEGNAAISHLNELKEEGINVLDRKYRETSMEPITRVTVEEVSEKALTLLGIGKKS